MTEEDRPLVWLAGELKTPPFGREARLQAGFLLRRLQRGERVGLPHARPLPSVGRRCHELRIGDGAVNWRIVFALEKEAVVILEVFRKKTRRTPGEVLQLCRTRLENYRRTVNEP